MENRWTKLTTQEGRREGGREKGMVERDRERERERERERDTHTHTRTHTEREREYSYQKFQVCS